MCSSNFVYGKYTEKYNLNYITKIARPIFIVEYDKTKIIEDISNKSTENYLFSIKNFDDEGINQVKFSYYFELEGINDEIEYQLLNLTTGQVIVFENGISNKFNIGFEKELYEYSLNIDFSKSNIKGNSKINLKIYTDIYEE